MEVHIYQATTGELLRLTFFDKEGSFKIGQIGKELTDFYTVDKAKRYLTVKIKDDEVITDFLAYT